MLNEVVQFLKDNPVQYLATVDGGNKPKVRPFQFMLEKDGKLYFCTSNKKDVYKELAGNPYVELCATSKDMVWIRLSGRVVFSADMDLKEKVLEKSPLVKSLYKQPDNPAFEVFYLEDAKAVFADFSGRPPRTAEL